LDVIVLENLTKTFGAMKAVDDLSLRVPEGSVYGFIGPNGSGKTTTLRMIMNILYPDQGRIHLFGRPLEGACSDRIGYMPEERGLYRRMKVKDLLVFYGRLKNGRDVERQAMFWLDKFGLTAYAHKKLVTLSKGMSQKVQFIATVVAQPEIIILDEPFSGLDPVNAEVLKDAVLDLQSRGTTVIFSTHDMHVAEKMCDFIFMIFKGKKVLDGTLQAIQDAYSDDTIRIRTEKGVSALEGLSGIERINDFGQLQEVKISPEGDAQKVLGHVLARTRVLSFELTRPSLQDIFVRIAGAETQGGNDA